MTFKFSLVNWSFYQTEADYVVNELIESLGDVIAQKIVAHYKIETTQSLEKYNFNDKLKLASFMADFADFANSRWKNETNRDWEFRNVPFRTSAEKVQGLIKVFQSGGACSPGIGEERALDLEKRFRDSFQQNSDKIFIFCVAEYNFAESSDGKSFTVNMKTYDSLKNISSWFSLVAWDDLMFIINPKSNDLYVIALTDED